jgi:ketosteroid isomerase-like protein
MSSRHVELVKLGWEALQRGDLELLRAGSHPGLVIVQPPDVPDTKTYTGETAFAQALEDWPREWDDFHVELLEVIDVGQGQVVSVSRHHGRGGTSGIEMDFVVAYLHTFEDDQLTRLEMFFSKEQALAAAR